MRKALFVSVLLALTACAEDLADPIDPGSSEEPRDHAGPPQDPARLADPADPGNSANPPDSPPPARQDGGASSAFGGATDRSKPTLRGLGDGETRDPNSVSGVGGWVGSADAGIAPAPSAGGFVGGGGFAGGGTPGGGAAGGGAPTTGSSPGGAVIGGGAPGGGASAPVGGSSSGDSSSGSGAPTFTEPTNVATPANGLTAGAWDDNLNYARFDSFRSSVSGMSARGVLPFTAEEFQRANAHFATRSAKQKLDVALVIDTTGSMGDEITYLQREFIALSRAIEAAYPASEQRWALVVYKDRGDEYTARWFDFRNEPEAFREKLAAQSAGGGGDFPEAPEAAFEAMNQFAWRTADDVARLAFWVADAPHHDDRAEALAGGIRTAQGLGVHVYPVASSGIDEFTELTMRSAAQLTGGRYLFLTNDSGIGNSHKEPSIPCYFVTSLNDAITRMVEIELSGSYREPARSQILRTGGNPQDGACKLASGSSVLVF